MLRKVGDFLMRIQPAVKQETQKIAGGTLILSAVMILVFVLIGEFDLTVIWGTLLGCAAAIGNFFLLGLSVQQAAEKMNGVKMESYAEKDAREEAQETDPDQKEDGSAEEAPEIRQAKRSMQTSYTLRMLLLGITAVIGITAPIFHSVAVLVPLLFPQVVIRLTTLIQTRR